MQHQWKLLEFRSQKLLDHLHLLDLINPDHMRKKAKQILLEGMQILKSCVSYLKYFNFSINKLYNDFEFKLIFQKDRAMNYYQLLDLETTSPTERQLKKAFRDASKKYHPDKNLETDTTE